MRIGHAKCEVASECAIRSCLGATFDGRQKMSFGQAVSAGFKKYAVFGGRTGRSEFWYWVLFVFIVTFAAAILDALFGTRIVIGGGSSGAYVWSGGWITTICNLVLAIPSLAIAVRRLHDVGKSGWWWLLTLVCCIGSLILIFAFYIKPSGPENKWGPAPSNAGGGAT